MTPSPRAKSAIDALGLIALSRSGPVALASIASSLNLSTSYLEQIFAVLKRHGVVDSVRGPGGGYRLIDRPGAVTIARIAALFDSPAAAPRGPHADFWSALDRDIAAAMARKTLVDVAAAASTAA